MDHPRLSELAARAVRHAGVPLPAMPTELLVAVVEAWEAGDLAPCAMAAAQWAYENKRALATTDAEAVYGAARCELGCRGYAHHRRLVRFGPPSEFGMGGQVQALLGQRFIHPLMDSDKPALSDGQ